MQGKYAWLENIMENRVLVHMLFWLGVILYPPLFSDFFDQSTWEAFIYRSVNMPIKIIATYLLVYYQIPTYFRKGRYGQFIITFVVIAWIMCVLYRINNIYIAETLAGSTDEKESIFTIFLEFRFTIYIYFLRVYHIAILFLFLKVIKDWSNYRHLAEELKKEKATAELNFLKAQLHPHFLFNTLNNIYALALEKSDDTPEAIAKLSEILDYIIYQGNKEQVLVSKEIELIQNYIDLEMLRYGDRLALDFEHQLDRTTAKISPLILLSIVENAFKHGASGAILNPVIAIKLVIENNKLLFEVFNSKSAITQQDLRGYKKGIGSKNVKRQLDLAYSNCYELAIEEKEDTYFVKLNIDL